MIRALLLLCLCLASFADAKKPSPIPNCSAFGWCKIGTVPGVTGAYTPVVQLGGSQIRVYSNYNGTTDGNLYLRVGSWSSVGSASMVLHIADPRDTFIRTSGIAKGASGTYYAILYTGDGYPTVGGYSPSWATSPDGLTWTWHGPIGLFGRNQSSAMNLVVDESRVDSYACMAWLDGLAAGALVLMHAPLPCDPSQWVSDGLNQWPIAGESPQFVSVARTQYGYHMFGCIPSDYSFCGSMRHLFSCTGFPPWNVLELNSNAGEYYKGTNVVVDAPNGLLHALTADGFDAYSTHFTLPVRAYPC